MVTQGGFVTNVGGAAGASPLPKRKIITAPALGDVDIIMAAFTDNSKWHRFVRENLYDGEAVQVTATFGGTAADIKAVQVIVIGTDENDDPLTESLPAATVNTAGSVTSVGLFKTITSIEIPPHDGTGATTSIGISGAGAADILAAHTDLGVASVFVKATMTSPLEPRNITATAGGTNTDVKAIVVKIGGKNVDGTAITENLPAFTVNTNGTVVGSKAFAVVDYAEVPAHDGNGATTSIGTGAKLGLSDKLARNTVLNAYLNNVKEGTPPTVAVSSSAVESNTVALASALDGTDVVVDYLDA
jgi:hypothetical protein